VGAKWAAGNDGHAEINSNESVYTLLRASIVNDEERGDIE
jgi:hypothetical protein